MMTWQKRSLILLVFLFSIFLLLATLIYTSLGLRAVTFILKKSVPELHIEQINGTLYHFEMQGLSFNRPGITINIDNTEFALSGLCLLRGALCIEHFSTSNARIAIATDKSPEPETKTAPSEKPFILKTPLTIELQAVSLKQLHVQVNDMQIGLDQFDGSAIWIQDHIKVYPTSALGLKAIFSDKPQHSKKNTTPVNLQQKMTNFFSEPLIHQLSDVHIPIKVSITELTGTNWLLHLGSDYYFNNVSIQGEVNNSDITVSRLVTDTKNVFQDAHVVLTGHIKLAKNWPIMATLNVDTLSSDSPVTQVTTQDANKDNHTIDRSPVTKMTTQVSGNLLGKLAVKTAVTGNNILNLTGNINLVERYLPIKIALAGKHIQWPLTGLPQYQLDNFNLSLSGTTQRLNLSGEGQLHGRQLPDITIALKGESQAHQFNLNQLNLTFPKGNLDLKGSINWSSKIQWQAEAQFNGVNLPSQIPDWPIDLKGHVSLAGSIKESLWQAQIVASDLSGRIRKKPLKLAGSLSADSDYKLSADHFKLHWGQNKLLLNGNMNNTNPFHAKFDLPDLDLFSDKISGQAKGFFTVAGSLLKPIINTDIHLKHLSFIQVAAEHIHVKADTHFTNQLSGHVTVKAAALFYADRINAKKLDLVLHGNEQNHNLTLQMEGIPFGGTIKLDGHLTNNRQRWQGKMSDSMLKTTNQLWQLNHPIAINYDLDEPKLSVQAHCWMNQNAKLCLLQDMVITDKGNVDLELANLDMAALDLLIGEDIQILGKLSGKAAVRWQKEELYPKIDASLHSNEAFVNQRIGDKKLTIPFDVFGLNLQINDQKAKLDWRLILKEYGELSGFAQVLDPTGVRKLDGQISLNKLSLAIVDPILQSGDYVKGLINGSLRLDGTLEAPQINGKISLNQSDIKSSQLPADIHSLAMTLSFYGQSSTLSAKLATQDGLIDISGKANWETINDWQASVAVKGGGIKITKAPIQSMTIIPDILITATQKELNLGGKVRIPTARIKVESFTTGVINVSSDEVMLNNQLQEITPKTLPMNINSNLFIIIDDDVAIDAFGLNANLKGQLLVKQNKQGLGLNGQILIPKGRFHAYGQDLVIRKGELTFSGPVDMPMLNIEAIRNPDSIENNVIAGIRVTGTADNPSVKLFSDPILSEQETLSYILRGQGLEKSDQNENDMMTAILIGLGTAQGGKYIGNVGELFGIRDLSLDTQGVGDSSQFVVSGYILPNLQLKYGVGIFDSLATFTLRYRLMPKLYLEVISSLAQSVDLLYQFEI